MHGETARKTRPLSGLTTAAKSIQYGPLTAGTLRIGRAYRAHEHDRRAGAATQFMRGAFHHSLSHIMQQYEPTSLLELPALDRKEPALVPGLGNTLMGAATGRSESAASMSSNLNIKVNPAATAILVPAAEPPATEGHPLMWDEDEDEDEDEDDDDLLGDEDDDLEFDDDEEAAEEEEADAAEGDDEEFDFDDDEEEDEDEP